MTVECTATDLGPALGTMLLRLFPHLFKVRERASCPAAQMSRSWAAEYMLGCITTMHYQP